MFTNTVTYLTPTQLAYFLRCCDTTVTEWRKRGVGPAYHVHKQKRGHRGTLYTYPVAAVLQFTDGRWPKVGQFLTTKRAAKAMGISPETLRQRRRRGQGPEPIRLVGLVRYLPEECEVNHGD